MNTFAATAHSISPVTAAAGTVAAASAASAAVSNAVASVTDSAPMPALMNVDVNVHVPGFTPAAQADEDALTVSHVHLLQSTRKPATATLPLHGSLLLDHLRARARALGRSARTEQAYVYWARHFIWHHRHCDPQAMGWREWDGFQTQLEYRSRLSVNTRRQALSALRFFYREVLGCLPPGPQRQRWPG